MNFDWSDVMHSAATEARRQQDEFKLRMQEIVNSHEEEIERLQKEHEMNISQLLFDADERCKLVEKEAAREIDHVKREMEHKMLAFREETIKAAEETIHTQLTSRQDALETQYQTQREQLVQECELILNEKDEEMQKCIETNEQQHQLNLQLNLERLYHQHHEEMEELRKEVWSAANKEMKSVHDEQMAQVLAEADDQCKLLYEEMDLIRSHLQAKDDELRSSAENISDMDKCFVDVAREISAKHNNEISILSDENLDLSHRNQRLERDLSSVQANNASLKEELHQLNSKYRSIELKVLERDEMIRTLDQRKTDFQSCKQILESQVCELKADNASLTKALELKTATLFEMTAENKDLTSKVNALKTQVEKTHQLEDECAGLKRRCSETKDLLEAFEREKRRYAQEMEYRLTQKEGQIAQLVEKSNNKTEPVVVHLHGDQGDARRRTVDASSECHHLRTRLLELQRSNYRLESDLMDAKRVSQVQVRENNVGVDESANHVHQLQQENQSLKQIIAMMRKEMEQLSPDDKSNEDEEVPSSYTLALEQQLIQSRAYLDVLLKSSDFRLGVSGDDELHFLRTRYRELHSVLDHVRDENLRLQSPNAHLASYKEPNHSATAREQELVEKLEEASDEIEGLIEERDNLLKMFRGPKDECRWIDNDQNETYLNPRHVRQPSGLQVNDKNLKNAILNDMSKSSYDEESQTLSSAGAAGNNAVACFGKRPPISRSYSDSRPSRSGKQTASSRATESQRRSLQRMAGKTRSQHANKSTVRNWNK